MGAILDYAVEEELSEEKAKDLEMSSCTPNSDKEKGSIYTCFCTTQLFHHRYLMLSFSNRRSRAVAQPEIIKGSWQQTKSVFSIPIECDSLVVFKISIFKVCTSVYFFVNLD